jgi:hypothetical protein
VIEAVMVEEVVVKVAVEVWWLRWRRTSHADHRSSVVALPNLNAVM